MCEKRRPSWQIKDISKGTQWRRFALSVITTLLKNEYPAEK